MNTRCVISLTLCVCIAALLASTAEAQLKQIQTENLRLVYYGKAPEYLTPHVGRCYENAFSYHSKFWNFNPDEKTLVVVYDAGDYANAGAIGTPTNRVFFQIAPISLAYETAPANERVNTMMNHEMTHIVMLDKSTGSERFFRSLFAGKVIAEADNPMSILYSHLTSPRRSAPRWYHEGIAVFIETWMAGGIGRAMGSYDEMVFRTLTVDSARIYDPVGLESEGINVDFQVGVNSYLYGARFMSYLALQFGPESVVKWVSRDPGSKSYYSTQFKNVYGRSLGDVWDDWIAWEREFQAGNLATIREYPVTGYRDLSDVGLGSMSGAHYYSKTNKLYTAVHYPGEVSHIAAIDVSTGKKEKICDLKGPALYFVSSLALDTLSGTLFYTADNNSYRDLMALDLESGSSRTLISNVRAGDLAYSHTDSTLWGVRHFNGISTLTRFRPPYDEWDQVYSFPFGRDIYDLSVSPDGRTLSAGMGEVTGRQTLVTFEIDRLLRGDTTHTLIFDFGHSIPATFTFSNDGRYLYGSSYYTGVSNIFRFDLQLDSLEALSNSETGLFRPLPVVEDSLIVFRYTSKGFVPSIIALQPIEDVNAIKFLGQTIVETHPVVKDWIAPGPGTINFDSMIVDSGEYHALANLDLNSLYPIVEGYKDYPAYGMRANFSELLGRLRGDLTLSYTPNSAVPEKERIHFRASSTINNWGLNFAHNGADFYDLFGPTKTSRKGQSLGLSYSRTLIQDDPKTFGYSVQLSGYQNLERMPDYQNIATTYDEFLIGGASMNYSNRKFSLGAIEYEKGVRWSISGSSRLVKRTLYPRVHSELDLGIALPWKHATVWWRNSVGHAVGERTNPFAYFYFGGFGNNWVDHQSEKRYRAYYAFPGTDINRLAGKNYVKSLVEWVAPPIRFRKLGIGAMYLTYARLALFSSGIVTNLDFDEARRYYGNVGAQMDFRITFLSYLRTTVSVGYAVAARKGTRRSDEFMFSVKIL